MSRSFKKNPFIKICGGDSNKKDRRIANRKFRRVNNLIAKQLATANEDNLEKVKNFKKLREVSDVWSFSSDGLAYYYKDNVNIFTRGLRKFLTYVTPDKWRSRNK